MSTEQKENLLAKMGRPKIENALRNKVSIRLDDETFLRLEKSAKEENLSLADLIRKALNQYWQKK